MRYKHIAALFLLLTLSACGQSQPPAESTLPSSSQSQPPAVSTPLPSDDADPTTTSPADPEGDTDLPQEDTVMQMVVEYNGNTIAFELNDSQAARELYDQLPLTVEIEDFSTNEKIFYPPEDLDTTDAPQASGGAGTLAYYAPWGDVVLFYDAFGGNGTLYELGRAVEGGEWIETLSGTVTFQKSNGEAE